MNDDVKGVLAKHGDRTLAAVNAAAAPAQREMLAKLWNSFDKVRACGRGARASVYVRVFVCAPAHPCGRV